VIPYLNEGMREEVCESGESVLINYLDNSLVIKVFMESTYATLLRKVVKVCLEVIFNKRR